QQLAPTLTLPTARPQRRRLPLLAGAAAAVLLLASAALWLLGPIGGATAGLVLGGAGLWLLGPTRPQETRGQVHRSGSQAVAPFTWSDGDRAFVGLKNATYIQNSIGMVFVEVPAGKFTMGSPNTEPDRNTEAGIEKLHDVTITQPFYLGVFTVAQEEYE